VYYKNTVEEQQRKQSRKFKLKKKLSPIQTKNI